MYLTVKLAIAERYFNALIDRHMINAADKLLIAIFNNGIATLQGCEGAYCFNKLCLLPQFILQIFQA